jgi:hypothetical protein
MSIYQRRITGQDADGFWRSLRVKPDGSPIVQFIPAANDLFGRLRVSEPAVVFAASPSYDVDPLTYQTMTSGDSNTATWSPTARAVVLTLAAAGYVVRQSYRHIPYELGRPVRITLTGNWGNDVAVTRERGQMDAANGVFWQRKPDGTMAVGVRSSTSGSIVNTIVDEADWNGDAVDFTPSHNNVYIIEYVWLGAFAVRWGIATAQGVKYVHTTIYADELPFSYMQTANLPMRDAIYAASAPASAATMQIVCSAYESEGGYAVQPAATYAALRTIAGAIAASTAPTEVPVVAIRPALLLGAEGQQITNRVQAAIDDVEVYATAAVQWSLWYFPPGTSDPVTGGSWARANTSSSVEANVTGTALSLTGGLRIASGFTAAAGSGGNARGTTADTVQQTFPLTLNICGANSPLESAVGASPAYLVLSVSGTGNASGVINWRETR